MPRAATMTRWIQYGLLVLVALMPFHAFGSVWLGSLTGHQDIWQSWKEVLVVIIGLGSAVLVAQDPKRLQRLRAPWVYAAGAFVLVALLITLVHQPSLKAIAFGLKTDVEFLAVALAAALVSSPSFITRVLKTILISSAIVIGFGLVQIYVLPADWLHHFGYGPTTIQPFLGVDPAVNSIRILSTLGGPNQLGSFLILPLSIVAWLLLRKPRWWHIIYLAAGTIVLWHTFARAAWLGFAAAILALLVIRLPRMWRLPFLLLGTIVFVGALQAIIHLAPDSKLQYYVYHQSATSTGVQASTDQHAQAYKDGVKVIKHNPEGLGLGTAGPASFHSDHGLIPESYYLQLGIEAGVLGMLLFIGVSVLIGIQAWHRAHAVPLAAGALAALGGVSVVNLFLHGWADSSTAIICWIALGSIGGTTVLSKRSHYE